MNIPVFGDAPYWKILKPNAVDPPPQFEGDKGTSSGGLTNACGNRHNGYTHWVFLDWSVKAVGLKAIWSRNVMWRKDWIENLDQFGTPNWDDYPWMQSMPDRIK